MAELCIFRHEDCEHFELVPCHFPTSIGTCEQACEHLRQAGYNPDSVAVDGDEDAAEVWLANMQIKSGCPAFSATQDALDSIAEELQDADDMRRGKGF